MMLTIDQIRAARALLDWNQEDLARHAGLSQTGIARIENRTNKPNTRTLQKIEGAFDRADIEFIGSSGLRKRKGEIRTLNGQEGFRAFMDDVFETIKKTGGEICVHNVNEQNWTKWLGEDYYKFHSERMNTIELDYNFKILIEEGDRYFIASDIAEYRWFPSEMFNDQSFYAYGRKLALIRFQENDVRITILNQPEFREGYNALFNVAWDHVAQKIPQDEA